MMEFTPRELRLMLEVLSDVEKDADAEALRAQATGNEIVNEEASRRAAIAWDLRRKFAREQRMSAK